MRRKIKKRSSIFFKMIFISIVLITLLGGGYAYIYNTLSISGQVKGQMKEIDYIIQSNSNPDFAPTISFLRAWDENYLYKRQYVMIIKNKGIYTYTNMKITMEFLNTIDSVDVLGYNYKISGKRLTLTKEDSNLLSNQSSSIHFTVSSKKTDQEVKSILIEGDKKQ